MAFVFCGSLFSIHAQDDQQVTKYFNELKLNGRYLDLDTFDITYERTINEELAFGITLFVPLDHDDVAVMST